MKSRALKRKERTAPAGLVMMLFGLTACGSSVTIPEPGDPPPVSGSQLLFLRPAANSLPLLTTDTSVVATRGQQLKLELFYAPAEGQGGERGERFLRFELKQNTLLRYPQNHPRAGALFQTGDTITIRVHVAADTLLARFEPSGLQFNPDEPAQLELSYVEADRDFDDDGQDDPELEGQIDLWRQEAAGQPWFRTGQIKDLELDEIEALLTSFTRYALAI
ncbi:MAG: hypothetical protein ACE5HQ_04605 [Gemmatimonadota bacterium]